MRRICIICLLFCSSIYAYTPSLFVEQNAISLSNKVNAYLNRLSSTKKTILRKTLLAQLPALQIKSMEGGDLNNMYLMEYVRRHISGSKNIDAPDLIDDDDRGFTWTHAPQGFEVFYYPSPVPAIGSLKLLENFSTLINGSYFSRMEGGIYPSGLLSYNGQVYTEFIPDDKQLTHLFCREKNGQITLQKNSEYISEEDILARCNIAFQAGPLVYQKHNGSISEDLALKTYIGSAHTRTVIVIFEKENGEQDVWFLTAYAKMTLAQVRDAILSETRFYGTYKNVSVLNLDGGSSVAYVSRKYPELNFGTSKKLPIVFGIK